MRVQLLYFAGCPNAAPAGEALARVLRALELSPTFETIDVSAPDVPEDLRAWGSPTILVDGRDVAGAAPSGPSCRVYRTARRAQGWPPEDLIRQAIPQGAA